MRRWRVSRNPESEAEYQRLSPERRRKIKRAMRELEAGPTTSGAKELEGHPDVWSVRVDRWRIVYEIDWERRAMLVTRIRPRPTAYEGLERP